MLSIGKFDVNLEAVSQGDSDRTGLSHPAGGARRLFHWIFAAKTPSSHREMVTSCYQY